MSGVSSLSGTAFQTYDAPEQVRFWLFCFPYAGGGASGFRSWHQAFPSGTAVHVAQYPSRENRMAHPRPVDFDALVDEVWAGLDGLRDVPFALFGHSMGGSLAFELALRAQRNGRAPQRLFVSATHPPRLAPRTDGIEDLPEPEFLAAIEHRYGAFNPLLRQHPDLLRLQTDILRADLRLYQSYSTREQVTALAVPITAIAAESDACATPEEVREWRNHTCAGFTLHRVPGEHLYLREDWRPVAAIVRAELDLG